MAKKRRRKKKKGLWNLIKKHKAASADCHKRKYVTDINFCPFLFAVS